MPGFPAFPSPPVNVQTIVTPLGSVSPRIAMQDEWVHITPTFGVDWAATEDDLVYVNTTHAFKPGGFSAYADDPAFVAFDEETVWTTELGVRSSHFDGKVNTNLVGFYSRVDDYHLENGFFARVEMVALGNVRFDDFNRDEFQQRAYVLLNSSVGFRKDQWSVALYGSNLADKEYYTNMNLEVRTGAVGIQRAFGVRVGREF